MRKILLAAFMGVWAASAASGCESWVLVRGAGCMIESPGGTQRLRMLTSDGRVFLQLWDEGWAFKKAKTGFLVTFDRKSGWRFDNALADGQTATVALQDGEDGVKFVQGLMNSGKASVLSASGKVVMEVSLAGSGDAVRALQKCKG